MLKTKAFLQWCLTEMPDTQVEWLDWTGLTVKVRLTKTKETPTAISDLFSLTESVKTKLQLAEYSLGPATLEQIFHTFAQEQVDLQPAMGGKGQLSADKNVVLKETLAQLKS